MRQTKHTKTETRLIQVRNRLLREAPRMDAEARSRFMELIERQSRFSGIRVIQASIASDQFTLVLEREDAAKLPPVTPEALFRRLAYITAPDQVRDLAWEYRQMQDAGETEEMARFLARYAGRMHNIPVFMREVQQKFTCWFNRRHARVGTIWESRYKTVPLESDLYTLAMPG